MTKRSFLLLAAALLAPVLASAVDTKVTADPTISVSPTPINNPTVSGPSLAPGMNVPSVPSVGGGIEGAALNGSASAAPAAAQGTSQGATLSAGQMSVSAAGASAAQGAAPASAGANASAGQAGVEAAPQASAAAAEGVVPRGNATDKALSTAVEDIRKAQAADAAASPDQASGAADAVRRLFDLDRAHGGTLAGPRGPAGSVTGRSQEIRNLIAQKAQLASAATTSPHDAPGLYRDAVKTAEDAATQGALTQKAAQAITRSILGYAARAAQTALTSIANSAYAGAAAGDADGRREVARALGTAGAKGSLDQWDALLGAPAKPLIVNKARLKQDIARVLAQASSPGASKVSAPEITFVAKGPLSFEAELPASSVAPIPDTFLAGLAAVAPGNSAAASSPRQPFDPGFSVLDGYRRLRAQGVAFWPAARFVVQMEARDLWESVAGKTAPSLSPEKTDALFDQIDVDYAAGDAPALASDYQRLTGDADPAAAVAAAEQVQAPDARRYWLDRIHDLAERRRPERPIAAAVVPGAAAKLAGFAAYVSRHRRQAAANVDAIEADSSALASLQPVGLVRAGGQDLWVERAVVGRGKARRELTLGLDAETREPLFGSIAR